MKPKLLTISVAISLALCTFQANSGTGGIVFDPSNFSQNIITAAKTTAQYIKQLEQYATQLKQLTLLDKNSLLKLIHPDLASVATELQRVNAVANAATKLHYAIGTSSSMAANIKALYGASQMSPADFAKNIATRRAAGDALLDKTMNSYAMSNSAVSEAAASLNVVAKTMKEAEGTNQLLQGLNKSIMIMVTQNNALIEATQIQNTKTARDLAAEDLSAQGKQIQLNVQTAREAQLKAMYP